MPTNVRVCAVVAVCLGLLPAAGWAQGTKSSAAAKQLSETLDKLKLDSIAAPDPTDPSTFVAALYFQGSTLLVVSAKYAAPPLLTAKLAKKDYRDVYIDLNAASVAGSKIFVMDQLCDGLVAKPDGSQAPDSWESGPKTTAFDGDWKKAKMSEDEYLKAFSTADEQYARILMVLTESAKKAGS